MITVQKLIKMLKRFPSDAEVTKDMAIYGDEGQIGHIDFVAEEARFTSEDVRDFWVNLVFLGIGEQEGERQKVPVLTTPDGLGPKKPLKEVAIPAKRDGEAVIAFFEAERGGMPIFWVRLDAHMYRGSIANLIT